MLSCDKVNTFKRCLIPIVVSQPCDFLIFFNKLWCVILILAIGLSCAYLIY